MDYLRRDDMLRFIEEINSRLSDMNRSGEVYIVGGAAISLAFGGRDATEDIDAIYKPLSEIRKVVKAMADEYNLRNDWLNNDAEHYVTEKMSFSLLKEYSNLKVFHIDAECLLAMKLASARPDTSPDMEDCLFLMEKLRVSEEKELLRLVELYTEEENRDPAYRFFTKEACIQYYQNQLEKSSS